MSQSRGGLRQIALEIHERDIRKAIEVVGCHLFGGAVSTGWVDKKGLCR